MRKLISRERYIEIRKKDNPIFNYFLEAGGIVSNIDIFRNAFSTYVIVKQRMSPTNGYATLLMNLDKLYEY